MLNNELNIYLGVFAFPFSSLEIINKDYISKCLINRNNKDKYVDYLHQARNQVIDYLKVRYNIKNEDEINLFLEKWYLYPQIDANLQIRDYDIFDIMLKHLKNFSKSLITQLDGKIKYKYWKNEIDNDILGAFAGNNKIYLFHSINRAFSIDILAMIYMVENKKPIEDLYLNYGAIEVSDSILDDILKAGVAENHLHVGGSGSFLSIWNIIMEPTTSKTYKQFCQLANIFEHPSLSTEHIQYYLFLASILRIVISLLAQHCQNSCDYSSLRKTLCYYFKDTKDKYDFSLEVLVSSVKNDTVQEVTDQLIKLQQLQITMINICNGLTKDYDMEEILEKGIIKTIFKQNLDTSNENIFLYKALSFLSEEKGDNEKKHFIKKLLFTYLRIKNYFFQQLVQQKSTSGLDRFQKYYKRNSQSLKKLHYGETSFWDYAILEQIQIPNILKIEFRTSVGTIESKARLHLKQFFSAYLKILQEKYCQWDNDRFVPIRKLPRIGFVFHLLKREQYYNAKCCCNNNTTLNLQYMKLIDQYNKEIEIIKNLRNLHGCGGERLGLDKFIVGIDMASLENAVPTWAYAEIFEKARDSSSELLKKKSDNFQSLRFTIHAGEDFRHILTGIRRIYESIIYLKFHSGDRIGHGIALGLAPKDWYSNNKAIIIPRGEALYNYVWAYKLIEEDMEENALINIAYLEKQIFKLFGEIFGDNVFANLNTIIEAYHRLHTSKEFHLSNLEQCLKCDQVNCYTNIQSHHCSLICQLLKEAQQNHILSVANIVQANHCQHFLHKINQPIHLKITEQDIIIAEEVQKTTRKLVNEYGIIIEVNPSSNVIIADIDTIKQHQIYNINNHNYDFDNVLACINSDDPAVFNTNIANELGYIYFGMIERGVSREAIIAWIEKLRRTGMMASFIKDDVSDEIFLEQVSNISDNL